MITLAKYSGCGNTFLLFDNRAKQFDAFQSIPQLCSTYQTDGLILLEKGRETPFRMKLYNNDGSSAAMCGNGIRCLGRFLADLGLIQNQTIIETEAGLFPLQVREDAIAVEMGSLKSQPQKMTLTPDLSFYFLNTGVPHAVLFVPEVSSVDLTNLGPFVRYHPYFSPQGTNVSVAQITPSCIYLRTYERGVEGETGACGTAATATAHLAHLYFGLPGPFVISPPSRDLLHVEIKDSNAILIGPARFEKDCSTLKKVL